MARTIQSPGVEINEIDLSLVANLPVGTNIFIQGFAAQGPTQELINVTSVSELTQIYGDPTNSSERYFYNSAKQVLQSPGNLITNRLPYGLSGGTGTGNEYSALLYPASGMGYATTSTTVSSEVAQGPELLSVITTGTSGTTFSDTLAVTPVSAGSLTIDVSAGGYTFTDLGAGALTGVGQIPAVSGTIDYGTGAITLDFDSFDILTVGTAISATTYGQVSAVTTTATATALTNMGYTASSVSEYVIGAPTQISLTEAQYNALDQNDIAWATAGGDALDDFGDVGNAGFIILNELKTTVDNNFEGYYLGLVDTSMYGNNEYNGIGNVKYWDVDGVIQDINTAKLEFNLTGTEYPETDSISEDLEGIPGGFNMQFDISANRDVLGIGLFKIRNTLFGSSDENNALESILIGRHMGSLNPTKTWQPVVAKESLFIENTLGQGSPWLNVKVNKNIQDASWSSAAAGDPSKSVRLDTGAYNAYALGAYQDPRSAAGKQIGNIPLKLQTGFMIAENKEQIPIDIVCDAGISTIYTALKSPGISAGLTTNANDLGSYDENAYLNGITREDTTLGDGRFLADPDTGSYCQVQDNWETIYNMFKQFAGTTRKDCLFISDPVRHIFVQGKDAKVLDDKSNNFSQHVKDPLKNLYAAANSNYTCTYGNWVKSIDSNLGENVWLPFSGFAANVMARMDANLQPWYAPAGLNNGLIQNIVDIGVNPTQKQRDLLYRISINPIVFFPGDGYTVWGQKTLQKKPSAFDRINVRRLFLVLEKATLAVMRYFVFEPNTVFTRTRVSNVLTPIFEIPKNNEGVYDYLIVCDERNNTPQTIDNNELIVDIYLKPVKAAEFILVNFIATRTDQDFTELI